MELHPNVNDPVVLRDHADREYDSRVEDLGAGLLVVVQPRGLPADETFGSGTKVSVVWSDSEGDTTVLPTQILAAHAQDDLQLWSLVVTGPALKEQRRRHERVAVVGPVALRPAAGDETATVTASLVDVSERAIRCSVETGSADAFLTGSDRVVAEFRLGTVDFTVPGRVTFLRPTTHPTRFEDLVVLFDEPVEDAEALREQVSALQHED